MKENTKLLCKMLGGSRAYGLHTEQSDFDWRGIFINTGIAEVAGLNRFEHQDLKAGGKDEFYFELRHFFCSLRKCNTQAMEILWTEEKNLLETTPEFKLLQDNRKQLSDTDYLYKSLRGYMQGERRLMNGERQGELGSKRRLDLEKYGYSPKNYVHLLRLSYVGQVFFEEGRFPVNITEEEDDFHEKLMHIKTKPQDFTLAQANDEVDLAEANLTKSYENRGFHYHFNSDVANGLCLDTYYPIIKQLYRARHELAVFTYV